MRRNFCFRIVIPHMCHWATHVHRRHNVDLKERAIISGRLGWGPKEGKGEEGEQAWESVSSAPRQTRRLAPPVLLPALCL